MVKRDNEAYYIFEKRVSPSREDETIINMHPISEHSNIDKAKTGGKRRNTEQYNKSWRF